MGELREKFLNESLIDLRNKLRRLGNDLILLYGLPEVEIPNIAAHLKIDTLFSTKEFAFDEIRTEKLIQKRLNGIQLEFVTGNFLYHPDDITFKSDDIPDIFTSFRKNLEKYSSPRAPLEAPVELKPLPGGLAPDRYSSGLIDKKFDGVENTLFKGGETNALNRLKEYIWETQSIKRYKYTRNGLLGRNYSSKFSPWLANGSLSPLRIYKEIKQFEAEVTKNISTYWLAFELIWRDFFRYQTIKHGRRLFLKGGIRNSSHVYDSDTENFYLWREGKTGIPFIDANMRELNETGFMSNRGRQNTASFLVKDLKIDWRLGASYFENRLIDYDVYSNWGNWNYIAGVGNDPRENRYFNILLQAKKYDPSGEYVKTWLPELKDLPSEIVHTPFLAKYNAANRSNLRYPDPILIPSSWEKHLDVQ
jgi:deoxyribodipyrimidine photo-lyase